MIATDPLSLVFIFCFLLGFGFFVATALMGTHGHAHGTAHTHLGAAHHVLGHAGSHVHTQVHQGHTHPAGQQSNQSATERLSLFSYINLTSVALFLFGFGFFGYFFHNATELVIALVFLLALGGGAVISACLLLLFNRLLLSSEGSTELDVADRTGMLGKVSLTIPEKGIGEVIYTSPGGMRKSIPARGLESQRLERDQEVVVVNYKGGVAEVDTWEHFMHEGIDSSHHSGLDELDELTLREATLRNAPMEMLIHQEQQREP